MGDMYEVDTTKKGKAKMKKVKEKKEKEKKEKGNVATSKSGGIRPKKAIGTTVLVILVNALFYYAVFPALNFQSTGMWIWLLIVLVFCTFASTKFTVNAKGEADLKGSRLTSVLGVITIICFATLLIGAVSSAKLFHAAKYASMLTVENGDFATDMPESEDITKIALMDTDSARIIGARAIGSLADVVSQYEVSESYSTIDYLGSPKKVAELEYAGFIKYLNNREAGVPGYVIVDPVKNEAKYVALSKPMKYTKSACFNENLERHVRFQYPGYIFNGYHFELDNEGNPYYVCPVLSAHAGLFGAKDVKGVVICDPCTGDSQYYSVGNVPNWVDRVYDGDLACDKYNWYGELSGGFWNSVFGNKGCKVTTDDYGYIVMDGDVWVYTGVTSVNGDESNIGFVLMNSRTAESKYYSVAGAEEYSAMSSAEGQVQNLGYKASFPSLINIGGTPTYIMVLKDNAGLVKMYALVNVEKYNVVATGSTQKEVFASYKKLLKQNGIGVATVETDENDAMEITVMDVNFIAVEGDTYVYVTDTKNAIYKAKFSENEQALLFKKGDKLSIIPASLEKNENGVFEAERMELLK